jgi:hypothetical protein
MLLAVKQRWRIVNLATVSGNGWLGTMYCNDEQHVSISIVQ